MCARRAGGVRLRRSRSGVARERVAEVREVRADLVQEAGHGPHLDERRAGERSSARQRELGDRARARPARDAHARRPVARHHERELERAPALEPPAARSRGRPSPCGGGGRPSRSALPGRLVASRRRGTPEVSTSSRCTTPLRSPPSPTPMHLRVARRRRPSSVPRSSSRSGCTGMPAGLSTTSQPGPSASTAERRAPARASAGAALGPARRARPRRARRARAPRPSPRRRGAAGDAHRAAREQAPRLGARERRGARARKTSRRLPASRGRDLERLRAVLRAEARSPPAAPRRAAGRSRCAPGPARGPDGPRGADAAPHASSSWTRRCATASRRRASRTRPTRSSSSRACCSTTWASTASRSPDARLRGRARGRAAGGALGARASGLLDARRDARLLRRQRSRRDWIAEVGVRAMNLLVKGSERHCVTQLRMTPEQHRARVAETIRDAQAAATRA